LEKSPRIREESSYPLTPMSREDIRQCAFRVIVYGSRIAVEFFHSLTDGSGGMIFLKTLTAEYLQQKYGIAIPAREGVVGRLEEPSEGELEDSFLKYAGPRSASRKDTDAWDVYVSALTTAPTGDPEYFFAATCRSDSTKNFGGYASPTLDSLAEQLHVTFGADERAKIATQMSQTILDDHGYFFVSFLQMGIVSKTNVKGMAAHPCDYYEITAALDV
jgi:ABC-type transport system substrate-binding protein